MDPRRHPDPKSLLIMQSKNTSKDFEKILMLAGLAANYEIGLNLGGKKLF